MLDPSRYGFCSEFYVVEKAVEVVVEIAGTPETIRIEAHKRGNAQGYCTRSFIQRDITVQPTYPQENGCFSRKPESITVWVTYDLPWTDRETADAALAQALSFLGERCGK
jgi:hypothetical protein